MNRAHSFEEIVEAGWAPTVHFLEVRARRGEIRARKVGRAWRMTADDIENYINGLANTPAPEEPDNTFALPPEGGPLRLTDRSRRRRAS